MQKHRNLPHATGNPTWDQSVATSSGGRSSGGVRERAVRLGSVPDVGEMGTFYPSLLPLFAEVRRLVSTVSRLSRSV